MLTRRDVFPFGEAGDESGRKFPHFVRVLRRLGAGPTTDDEWVQRCDGPLGWGESLDKVKSAAGCYAYPIDNKIP